MIFDLESDGLLDVVTKVHSLVIRRVAEPADGPYAADEWEWDRVSACEDRCYQGIPVALERMAQADELIGHNIIDFDLPVLKKLYGFEPKPGCKITDTLLCTRLIWPDVSEKDMKRRGFPPSLIGSHSLEAWGHRLGVLKGSFNAGGAKADWSMWTAEMQRYCEQDVEVNKSLWHVIERQNYDPRAIELEHRFRAVIRLQEQHGFRFDEEKAVALMGALRQQQQELTTALQAAFEPTVVELKTPEYYHLHVNGFLYHIRSPMSLLLGDYEGPNRYPNIAAIKEEIKDLKASDAPTKGWRSVPGPPRKKSTPFNPGSRVQIADRLMKRGWKPEKTTDSGRPQVDEAALESIDMPEAKLLSEYLLVEKRLGQLADGPSAWLKLARKGRIHGRVTTNGAVTGRCTHSSPNMAQVPSVALSKDGKYLYGREGLWATECRELFTADPGYRLVGADASGLELRCLAHYLGRWDGGQYADIVLKGDVHTANQLAFGLPEGKPYRNCAKTGIYCLIYGGGDWKLGTSIFPVDLFGVQTDAWYKRKGAEARRKFELSVPAYKHLVNAVQNAVRERGFLVGLDGRKLNIRSPHSALNSLLQSAGALIVKQGTVILYDKLNELGHRFGPDWALLAHVHDEVQIQARPDIAELVGKTAVWSFGEAGRQFGFRVPIDGEYKIGQNWRDCH